VAGAISSPQQGEGAADPLVEGSPDLAAPHRLVAVTTLSWSTCSRVELGQGGVTVGRPIVNTTVWILDDAGAPAPI